MFQIGQQIAGHWSTTRVVAMRVVGLQHSKAVAAGLSNKADCAAAPDVPGLGSARRNLPDDATQ
ncbi:hypothetical protein [Rivibacter subsaxonicus]|uniref:hypothetical protein n=1 Tax=Rivibacter subsaxonicus TaxID=457575 RepID=UPI00102C76BE|nr:hypothetical protein [Rivibacter subsaxonicus]